MESTNPSVLSVAVIIPVYNGAAFIREALESVFAQNYPIHEIVVVDDGSTDTTRDIVESYVHRGVRFIQQERQGPSAARNRGLTETKGDIIAFLDADDAWLPQKLSKQIALLTSVPSLGLVTCDTLWVDIEHAINRTIPRGVKANVNQRHEIAVRNFVGNTSHVVAWRYLIEEVGGFDPQLRWCEDWDLWTKLIDRQPAGIVHEPLVLYRWHSAGNAHQRRWERSSVVYEVARRAVSRVKPVWKRPFLLARASSIVHAQRARYALQNDMPRSVQISHALRAFLYSPLEKTSTKLGYCTQALIGKKVYQALRKGKRRGQQPSQKHESDADLSNTQTTLRILHLLPAFSIGGAEMLVLSLAAAANPEYINIHVCALFDRGKRELRSDLDKLGISVHCLNASHLYSPALFKDLAAYLREHQIDIIHTHLLSADVAGRLVGKLLAVPVVSTLHSVPQGFAKSRIDRRWLERMTALYMTNQLVTVAAHVRDQFVKEWRIRPEQLKVIYNAIPMERFLGIPECEICSERQSGPVIMTIGRLIPDKAHDLLIQAASLVLESHPEVTFIIVGDGSERERLTALIHSAGLEKRVIMTGMRRDIPELLAQCDIFVLPSRREGLPLSAVEAMAAARPVLVTDVGGNRELVTHGVNGMIIPPGDCTRLSEALLELIEHPEQRLKIGRAGRERVKTQFALDIMLREYETVYMNIVRSRSEGRAMRGVVMLVNSFPPVPAGGAERQAERLSKYLAAAGLAVGVITRAASGYPRHDSGDGFWIERVPQPGFGKLKTVTFMLGAAYSLVRRRNQYDILHAHLAFAPALVGALIARMLGKRVIVKYGTSGKYGDVLISQRKLRGRIRLALLRRWTDLSIALDEEMERELLQAGFPAQRVLRMDNGIDAQPFLDLSRSGAKKSLGLEGHTVAIYTGRLVTQKALAILLQALAEAIQSQPELYLLLVGQGPEREALEQQAQALGLTRHVRFVGNVQDVRPYLAAADIFVLPSEGEGISNALLEAMAAGLGCIATAVGGSPEVLDYGSCGLLVQPGKVEQLKAALVQLARDPQEVERLGRLARQRILTRYAFNVVGDAYQELYARLLPDSGLLASAQISSKEL